MKPHTLSFFAAVALLGCDAQSPDPEPAGGGISLSNPRAWTCDASGPRVTCSAPIAAKADEPGAYACMPDEDREVCPAAESFAVVEDAFDDAELGVLEAAPWACLLTGEHQRDCTKELKVSVGGDVNDDGGGGGGAPPIPDDGDGADGPPAGDPSVPTDCAHETWEAYFCQLATSKFSTSGVDITFPCDIFDATGSFVPQATDPQTIAPDAPSCSDGEMEMRTQAWVDAVGAGCMMLSVEILTLCQQAADYAPSIGACHATGTW